MRHKIFICLIITFALTSIAFGQTECDSIKYPKLLNNSYQCKWTFFKLDKSIEGIIIEHDKAQGSCGTRAFASLTIVKTDKDTIRILGLCNENLYLIGQKVKVSPENEPSFQVHLPSTFIDGVRGTNKKGKRKKQEPPILVPTATAFDKSIIKTTWGQISVTL